MTSTVYRITTDGGVMYASVDLARAASTIFTYHGTQPQHVGRRDAAGVGWEPTPYQSADAMHREREMARIVANHHDMGKVLSIEVFADA